MSWVNFHQPDTALDFMTLAPVTVPLLQLMMTAARELQHAASANQENGASKDNDDAPSVRCLFHGAEMLGPGAQMSD